VDAAIHVLFGVVDDLVVKVASETPVCTYNERHLTDLGRFSAVLGSISERRLTYATLTDTN
jgi:hypothetical protein